MPASRPKRKTAICLILASVLSSVISLPATGQNNSPGTEVDRTPNTQPAEGTGATKARQPSAKHTNQLAKESSPYLLQHAHNPVDWYPWGEEAFAKAKREGKMVFLSVGTGPVRFHCVITLPVSDIRPSMASVRGKSICSTRFVTC